MADTYSKLRGLALSAVELKALTNWPDALIEDYLNILNSLLTISEAVDVVIDRLLEETETGFTDGSIPFVSGGFLVEDNTNLFWDTVTEILNAKAIILSDATATRMLSTNASNGVVSVADLSAWVGGTANQVSITDDGDGTITLSTPQDTHTDADVEFDSATLDDLTASSLVSSDATKKLVSIAILSAWIAGTANQITVTDDGDGTVTLSTPQDIDTGANVTFSSINSAYIQQVATGNISVGSSTTMDSLTTGNINTVVGAGGTGSGLTEGNGNVLMGYSTGNALSTADNNIIIGRNAGTQQETTENSVMIGYGVGQSATDTQRATYVGYGSGSIIQGNANTFIGYDSGYGHFPVSGTADGTTASHLIDSTNAFLTNGIVKSNMVIQNTTDDTETTVDSVADGDLTLNADIFVSGENYTIVTAGANYNVGIGRKTLYEITDGAYNLAGGNGAGLDLRHGSDNVLLGADSGAELTDESHDIFLGYRSGAKHALGSRLIIDSYTRVSQAEEITSAILYGVMSATTANQTLGINADTTITDDLNVEGSISVGTDAPLFGFYDEGDIFANGNIKAMKGLFSESAKYGAGLEISNNALTATYSNVLHNDATLTALTQTITDSHASFTDSFIGQFIKILASTPDYTEATGEIVAVPSGTTLIVSMATAGGDAIVDANAMTFVVYPQPNFFVGDNGDIHASVGIDKDASFKISSPHGKNDHSVHAVVTAGVAGHTGIDLEIDAGIYGGVSGYGLNYDATGFVEDTPGTGINMVIDNAGATGGDLHGIDVAVSDTANTDMETVAVGTHAGVEVIHQHLGDTAAITKAYITDTSATITATTIAFNDAGPDTITDSGNGFVAAGFVAGQVIVVTGDSDNNGTYTIATAAANVITLEAGDTLSDELAGDSVTITSTFRDTTTAFGSSGTNVEMFSSDNDFILIASTAVFDEINSLLSIDSSTTIRPTFSFSVAGGTWTAFTPSDDSSGFQNSGTIRFDSDNYATWGLQTINDVTGAVGATGYYWIRIKRRRNNVAVPPTESTIKITKLGSFHSWDEEGRLGIKTFNQATEPTTTDIPAGKFCFWTDTDDSSLWICYNHGGTVKTTEMT